MFEANSVTVVKKMAAEEFRAVTKDFFKKQTASQIKTELDAVVHGDCAPSLKMVNYWMNGFNHGRISTEDEARPRRPIEVTSPDIVDKVYRTAMEDRRLKVRCIVNTKGISTE